MVPSDGQRWDYRRLLIVDFSLVYKKKMVLNWDIQRAKQEDFSVNIQLIYENIWLQIHEHT